MNKFCHKYRSIVQILFLREINLKIKINEKNTFNIEKYTQSFILITHLCIHYSCFLWPNFIEFIKNIYTFSTFLIIILGALNLKKYIVFELLCTLIINNYT